MEQTKATCPKCGAVIDVSSILYKSIEDGIQAAHAAEIQRFKAEAEAAGKAAQAEIAKSRAAIEAAAKESVRREMAESSKALTRELELTTMELCEMHKLKGELERTKRETNLAVSKALSDKEAETSERLRQELAQQKVKLDSEAGLKLKESEEKLRQMKEEMERVRQRAEQGSMQTQGEVQELTIEEMLRGLFPGDEITPIAKGQPGADCIQTVITKTGKQAGKIYFESKRTQGFDKKWLAKFKADNLSVNADLLVLASKTLPQDKSSYFLEDGVWVCPFTQLKDFCAAMREMILKLGDQKLMQDNKESKSDVMYAYLTADLMSLASFLNFPHKVTPFLPAGRLHNRLTLSITTSLTFLAANFFTSRSSLGRGPSLHIAQVNRGVRQRLHRARQLIPLLPGNLGFSFAIQPDAANPPYLVFLVYQVNDQAHYQVFVWRRAFGDHKR
ncbi:MAG: DUF2130 domain-containing protein [Elusimicrobiota bacterium]|nr:DUF2130 domain-containing protein [Elusimicrobiota bacterium]